MLTDAVAAQVFEAVKKQKKQKQKSSSNKGTVKKVALHPECTVCSNITGMRGDV